MNRTGRSTCKHLPRHSGVAGSSQAGAVKKGTSPPSRRLLAAHALALIALLACASPALAARGHVFGNSFGTPCTVEPCAPGTLKEPAGVAVSGDVYVVDHGNNRVERFSSTGTYLGQFDGGPTYEPEPGVIQPTTEAGHGGDSEEEPSGQLPSGHLESPEAIAVDNSCELRHLSEPKCKEEDPSNGTVYVVDGGNYVDGGNDHRVVDKFGPTGAYLGQITAKTIKPPEGFLLGIAGVAVDLSGAVWITEEHRPLHEGSHQFADHLDNAIKNQLTHSFDLTRSGLRGFLNVGWLAVDSEERLYVSVENRVGRYTPSSETLSTFQEGSKSGGGAVELATDDVYIDNETAWHRFSSEGREFESLSVPGGHGTGIAVGPVSNGAGTVYVADSSADVVYAYTPEPPGPPTIEAISLTNVTAVSADFQGELNPRSEPNEAPTSYRFEYVTSSQFDAEGFAAATKVPVPDGLLNPNYEVDTVTGHAQGLQPHTSYHLRLLAENSHDPGAPVTSEEVIFTTQPSAPFSLPDSRRWELVSPPDKRGAGLLSIQESGLFQAAADGDAMTYLASAPTEASPPGNSINVQVLSARGPDGWRSRDINAPHEMPSGAAGQEYRFFSPDLSLGLLQPIGDFVPSLSLEATEKTPFLRTNFSPAGSTEICTTGCYTPLVTAANVPEGTEFAHSRDGVQMTGASPDLTHVVLYSGVALTEGAPAESIYEWSGGQLQLISILPGAAGAAPGSATPDLGSAPNSGFPTESRKAISTDGSRVIWSERAGKHHLYLRDTTVQETVQLDAITDGSGEGEASPLFLSASPDASRIFFTDTQQLTADSGGKKNAPDLYECQITPSVTGQPECALTDLTPVGPSGESAEVRGVLGASEDGSYLYYATGPVSAPRLYLRRGSETVQIASLSKGDLHDWHSLLAAHTARVSDNGRWLAFMSEASPTGYDNRDAKGGRPDQEVFLYHAAEGGEGTLVCASCNPTGARPRGASASELGQLSSMISGQLSQADTDEWISANVPRGTPATLESSLYQSRYLSDSGRLFFNSYDSLAPQDTNGNFDVYQYEPTGAGDCSTASSTYSPTSSGCVSLISSGTSSEESLFLDASESGNDVFFLTSSKLSSRDSDSALDLYDARVGGGELEPVKPVECSGDACQRPATPPSDPTPGSLTFNGPGNEVPPEAKKAKKKHKARHHKKKSHQRAANNHRRATR